ncbi:tape measure protein [Pseudomonas fluorescens]|uniref:Uncharacterized protein n=1 Tax=Pseudomonas fluorescens TaxID=294 RepID=A0A5E6ZK09_PSEFL|nr:tape measure protein [Pseudomonas fluorescens]VVN64521.1 hypothetical protein PS723_00005 [Pseudomonas fluorescens]
MAGQEVQGMLIRLEATTAQMRQELARADSSVTQVSGRIDRQLAQVDSAFDRVGLSAQRAGSLLKDALSLGIGGAGIGALVSQAEAYTQIANRLKLVTSNSAEFTAAQNSVFSIAQKAGQPLGATAELYQRIAQNQDALKLSGKGVAGIVETISKTMVISGASAASSEAALVQLGQAFASGTLRGEELNSVMEQAPALSQAIAKGMGVSVGALRALGAEGNLTAESVVKALQAQQGAVDSLFGRMQDTIGVGLTRVQTSITKMVGEGDKVGGMSARISAAFTSASRAMDAITADGDAFAETIKSMGSALENVAYVGAAALALGTGRMAVSFAQATLASVQQAGALALSTKASLEALAAEAALARQSLLTAQTRQLEAKGLVERAGLELAAAEGKVASDRVRQASELGNLKLVQATLTAERELEGQRLKAQITDQGRTLSIARIAELRTAEAGAIRLVQAAEVSLAATTVATSAEITAALGAQTAARGVLAETTATTNAAIVTSDRAAAAATVGARATTVLSAASGGLLALLSGPVGLIAMTGLVAASFIDLGSSAKTATSALIDQNLTVDDSIAKFQELGEAQRTLQISTWTEKQTDALDEVGAALNEYSMRGKQAFQQLGMAGIESGEAFDKLMEEVRTGSRSLNSVTEWVKENKAILPAYTSMLEQTAAAYEINGVKADKFGKLLGQVSGVTVAVTSSTEKLKVAQKDSGQTDAVKASWDKYIEQLTKTRDLLGANAAAEAAYTAAKMGATPAQAAQAKLIADQTDALKKYQEAIKEGDKVQQASLKLQLVALYTAEDAVTQAAATQSKAYADTATAAENSARRQITAIEQAANFAVVSATRVAMGASAPQSSLSGYGLLTNGGTAPIVPAVPTATPNQRADAAIAQLDATTEANKRVDKSANAAATALKNQAKALDDLLAKSGISTKSANEMADAYLSGADNIRAITIQQKIQEELLKTGADSYDKVKEAVNKLQDAEDRRDVSKSISELKVEITQTLAQATATLQGTAALEAFNIQKSMTVALAGKNIEYGSKEYDQLLATTKAQLAANKALEQAGQVEGIVDRLNPQIKLLKDYTAEQDALNAAMGRYPESASLYQDALSKLGNEYEVNRSKATLWGQMTEGAVDRVDGVFADAWANIGAGGDSLWDRLVKGAKQAFGEIAHMLTTKPLLASISNWLTGTDNGQGLSAVWGKLLGGAGGSSGSSGSGSLFSGLAAVGKDLVSAWNAVTGVGAEMAAGWASGGAGGAASAGVNYYGGQLTNLTGVVKGGFNSLVQTITGTTVAQTVATLGAEGITTSVLSGAVTEGAAALGAQFSTGVATTTAATYAAAEASAAATAASLGGQFAAAMSSMAAMWPLAVVAGMYQSGKLYDNGVRPDAGEIMDSGGKTALGKVAMAPGAGMSKLFEVQDDALGKIVGGKWAAILSGSTLHQAVTKYVGEKLFGGAWETKNTGVALEVEDGVFKAQRYADQKKKGGLFSSSKKRTDYDPLVGAAADSLGGAYNKTILDSIGLVSRLGVVVNKNSLDGLDIAKKKINTKGKSDEYIQTAMNDWFAALGDSAVAALNKATGAGLDGFTFDGLATFANNLYTVNASFDAIGVKMVGFTVAGGRAVESLVALSGGMGSLQANISSYYDNFTDDTKKADDTLASVTKQFSDLDLVLPGTREAYKDMLEQLDMTDAYGQSVFNAMTMYAQNAAVAYGILEQRAKAAAEAQALVAEKQAEINANYYSLFTTDAEKANDKLIAITAQFAAMGVVLPATKEQYKAMVYAAGQAGESGKKLFDFLKGSAGDASDAFSIVAQRAETLKTNAIAGATAAMGTLQRSITAQQKSASIAYAATNTALTEMTSTASKNVSDLTSVGGDLSAALKALRGDSDEAVKTLRAQAVATLQSALATAKAGGSLAGFSGLEDALDTVGSNNSDLYGSLEDFSRDQGRTANVVAELNVLNGRQLTTAEKALEGLEQQIKLAEDNYQLLTNQFESELTFAQAQLDALNGVDTSIMTVAAAVAAMNAAVVAALASLPRSGPGSAAANTSQNNGSVIDSIYQSVLGREADAGGKAFWQAALDSGAIPYDQIAAAIRDAAIGNGQLPAYATGGLISGPGTGTSDSILARLSAGEYVMRAAAVSTYGTGLLDQMNSLQLPAFASGGGVGETGPQLEVTGPSRIFNANQAGTMRNGSGDQGATVAELRQLREEMQSNFTYIGRYIKATADSTGQMTESGVQIVGTVQTTAA